MGPQRRALSAPTREDTASGGGGLPAKALVIVESPTKARTIKSFLPKGWVVEASVGHIRDLPNSAKEIPAEYKDEEWSSLGIDVDNDFAPLYIVPSEKKKQVSKLKKLIKEAAVVYLATDEDREGESISWHLVEVLKPKIPQKRLVFHEITRSAIQRALETPRQLDTRLIQAQEARRILDRLYGYGVSPILWRKVGPRLSAGRVQSVAIRLVVQRERERLAFQRSEYWDLSAIFETSGSQSFKTQLVSLDGKRIASGKDFDADTGAHKTDGGTLHLEAESAAELERRLRESSWSIAKVERKPFTEKPAAPFTTSTLQQEANRKLRLSARNTMQAAQRLYENGLITYMRTDSTTLSDEAVKLARGKIEELYGSEFLSPKPRQYQTKVKNAQEAHEAIRPSGDFKSPDELGNVVGPMEKRVYELIWKRTMACQMAESRGYRTTLQVSDGHALFQARGKTIEFPGFLRAYVEGADDPDAELADKETLLPAVDEGEAVSCKELEAREHTTQPPARYTEASLVKEMEARGIGRPSTYASILETIQNRSYVSKEGNALVPSFVALAVVNLLEDHFERLVDYGFTASMEEDLDVISRGEKESVPYLREFYFGKGGLKDLLNAEIDPRLSRTLSLGKNEEGVEIAVRIGRYGPYLERGEDKANLPDGVAPDELTIEKAEEILAAQAEGPREVGRDTEGTPVYAKHGRFGPYVQLGDGEDGEKPKMKSLLPGMTTESVSLQEALQLLALPRNLGDNPANGEPVMADYGRYGPYVKCGTETRSLKDGDDILSLALPRALELLAEEKKRGRRTPEVLKELGPVPGADEGETVKMFDGRWGPYVTDGETNASLPRGTDPETVTLEQALEWIQERAARGPRKKKARKKKSKAAKKKATKKKAAKKKSKASKKKATKKKSSKAASSRKAGSSESEEGEGS